MAIRILVSEKIVAALFGSDRWFTPTFFMGFSQAMAIGSSGYFIFTVNTSAAAVIGNTVKVNGATNPVVFGFSTAPNITNNQTDLGGTQTLPVNLLSLTAKEANNSIQVNWVTTSELNNASFDIERSTDGINFATIGNTIYPKNE